MKCGVCHQVLGIGYVTVTTYQLGVFRTISLCHWCLDRVIGRPERRRLEIAIYKAGWEQPELFHIPDEPTGN